VRACPYAVPLIGTFVVDVDVERPHDLDSVWRQLRVRVGERLDDQRARVRANARAELGIRLMLTPADRQRLTEQESIALDDWRYYAPQEIEARVRRAGEIAVLTTACQIAAEHGIAEVPRWRNLLQQAGTQAAQDAWRREIANGCRRLTGETPAREEQPDPERLRRQLEDLAYAHVEAGDD
jgi:hypothetical protein